MNLYINSPIYYTNLYGINNDVYNFCWNISREIDIFNYTNKLDSIVITPIIAPSEIISKGKLKEIKHVSLSYRFSDISLCIDYEGYLNANYEEKKRLLLENIINSIKIVKRKLKFDFNYILFEEHINEILLKYGELSLIQNINKFKLCSLFLNCYYSLFYIKIYEIDISV